MKYRIIYILIFSLLAVELSAQKVSGDSACDYFAADSSKFEMTSEFDVMKALYGIIPGLDVSQGQGTNADNWSSLSYHGHAPLVLIDGIPRNRNEISATEIESITMLNDATAAAIYGVKGANGVLMIKTKRGHAAPLKITGRFTYGASVPTRMPDFADSYTYATYLNEALAMDGLEPKYNQYEMDAFRTGELPFYYPDVDWQKEVYKSVASNYRVNLSFNSGTKRFRQFTALDYMYDDALYRDQNKDKRYDSSHTNTYLSLRSNVDVDVTRSTLLKIGVMARLSQKNRAHSAGVDGLLYNVPSAAFPVRTEDGIYGGTAIYSRNPVAWINATGQHTTSTSTVIADIELHQKLDILLKGLSIDASVAFDYNGSMVDTNSKEYMYADMKPTLLHDGSLNISPTYYGQDSPAMSRSSWAEAMSMRTNVQGRVNYELDLDGHHLDAHLTYRQRSYAIKGRNQSSKTQEALANASYNYRNRYYLDAVANYSGTAYLKKGERFNLYPAVSVAWEISNENFFEDVKVIDKLKLFASFGKAGSDGNLSHELHLHTYGNNNAGEYYFTPESTAWWGQAEGNLPAENLDPEEYTNANIALSLSMFDNRLNIYGNAFMYDRSKILTAPENISGIIGIGVNPQCIGQQRYRGVDFNISWSDRIDRFSYELFANASYLDSEVIENGQAKQTYDYLYRKGDRVSQCYGLEVLGIFQSQYEINNTPKHTFTTVRPGDLMYKDQNNDGFVNEEDVVRMYGSTIPEFNFGFGITLRYANFELSSIFQGRAGVTVNLLSSPLYQPLVNNSTISNTFLEREIPWSPERADEATMPRLTTLSNSNNYRNNSMWYRDGSFLKLRNLKLSYTFTKNMIKFSEMQLFVQATNLFSLDNIKFADPEQLNAAYPSMKTFWAGIKMTF